MSPKTLQANHARKKILDALEKDGVTYWLDSEGNPIINHPHDKFQNDWPADSQRVNDLVVTTWLEVHKEYPKANDLALFMMQMRELCRLGGQRPSQDEEIAIESNPIIQGVVYVMNQQATYDNLTTLLHSELLKAQTGGKIAMSPEITPFANIFARQLRRLLPALTAFRVAAEFTHKEDGSHCKLNRLPGFEIELALPNQEPDDSTRQETTDPSATSPRSGEDLDNTDDSDGKVRVEREVTKGGEGHA